MTLVRIQDLKNADGMGTTIKLGAGMIIAFAADIAVTALLKQHVPVGKGIIRLLTKLGIFALGMKIGEDVETYFYKVCDDTKAAWDEAKKEAEKKVSEELNKIKDEGGH